jgi:hypothetical protein
MGKVDEAIAKLSKEATATSCADLVSLLEGLGFKVRRCSKGNHHTFVHAGLADFWGSDFDGGHDKHMKKNYVNAVRKLLERYRMELAQLLEVTK